MAYFTCGNSECNFTFKRTVKPDSCPDCGKPFILDATNEEIEEFLKLHPGEESGEPKAAEPLLGDLPLNA